MEEKVFFNPGEVVKLRQPQLDSPNMLVTKKEMTIVSKDRKHIFKGVRCRWFAKDHTLHEAIFNTKDLVHVS